MHQEAVRHWAIQHTKNLCLCDWDQRYLVRKVDSKMPIIRGGTRNGHKRLSTSTVPWRMLNIFPTLIALLVGVLIGSHLQNLFSVTLSLSSQILPPSYIDLYRNKLLGDGKVSMSVNKQSNVLATKAALDVYTMADTKWIVEGDNLFQKRSHDFSASNDSVVVDAALKRPSLLFMFASYTMDQFIYMQKALDCMRDICNSGWDVTVHVQAASGFNYSSPRYEELADRLFCVSIQKRIPLIVETYDKIGFGLNSKHRLYAREHLAEFDLFVYAEEDMIFTISHLRAYLQSLRELQLTFPQTWLHYYIGYLRWEDVEETHERVSWEYLPHQIHIVNVSPNLEPYVVTNNLNQAMYVLTRDHMIDLENRCGFLTDVGQSAFYRELRWAMNQDWKYMAVGVSEWSSSFQLVLQCGLRRIIPSRNLQSFMIQHSTNKGQKRRLRKDMLTAIEWLQLVAEKKSKLDHQQLDEFYNTIIRQQYNLHLIRPEQFLGKSKWSWELPSE